MHFLHVNGVKKPVPFYSLDVIISVGYRVKSKRGTDSRIWARKVLKQYLIKGMLSKNCLSLTNGQTDKYIFHAINFIFGHNLSYIIYYNI